MLMIKNKLNSQGFTLIEMAVVIFIIGLILGTILGPLSKQVEVSRFKETKLQLEKINQAILGFASANGYIPCPASATSNGLETRGANLNCSNQNGFVPYRVLGIKSDRDAAGVMLDRFSNRIGYRVSNRNDPSSNNINVFDFTRFGAVTALDDVPMNLLAPALTVSNRPLIRQNITVCKIRCNDVVGANVIAVNIPYILHSWGKFVEQSALEKNNNGNNNYFVDATIQEGVFEEILVWSSSNTLFSKMISAGQLP